MLSPVVPRVGFEPTSPRLQRGAFTRLASSAELVRTSGIEPLARRDRVYSAATAPACPYGTSHVWLRAPGLHRAIAAYETAWVPNRPTRAKDAKALTPSLAAGTSAVSRMSGGCLTCRSPHLVVPSRFERAPEAALVKHPCWRKAAVSIRSARAPSPLPTGAGPRPVHFPYWRSG